MSIDLSRFHQTFFEESFEGLDAMESGLLGLDPVAADAETVNTIFRAAHSIKGGAGTFGFSEIGQFTHVLETLLDQVRAKQRAPDRELIDKLLAAVDCLRSMLNAAQAGEVHSSDSAAVLQAELQAMLSGPAPRATLPPEVSSAGGWRIHFVPAADLMRSGNDPLRLLRELSRLGTAEIKADLSRLPALDKLEPEDCYLGWDICLHGRIERDAIQEVFAWVEDDCELSIEPLAAVVAAAASDAAPTSIPTPKSSAPVAEKGSIRVGVDKIDSLINLVGELVITQAMLQQLAAELDPVLNEKLLAGLGQLDRNTRHIQEAVMATRMLPVDFVFSRFPRLVRDLAGKLGKQVELQTEGEGAELDKSVIEKIVDPLNHIVRNSVDHGIEMPEQRRAAGKPPQATVSLSAWHQGGHIVIEVADDGRGLDRERILAKAKAANLPVSDSMADAEVWPLIFHPGLSTAEAVTDVSGRGVGMDVVRKNIQSLGGSVEIQSRAGQGTKVTIRLPLTLAIMDGMSVEVDGDIYILPLGSVLESMQPVAAQVKDMVGRPSVIRVRDEFIPLMPLREFFGARPDQCPITERIVVLVEAEGQTIALIVDALVGQQQVVIKSLETHYRRIAGISGATILGDGRVALIVDAGDIIRARLLAAAA